MKVKQGYSYHIKDSFFSDVSDSSLIFEATAAQQRRSRKAVWESALAKRPRKNLGKPVVLLLEAVAQLIQ